MGRGSDVSAHIYSWGGHDNTTFNKERCHKQLKLYGHAEFPSENLPQPPVHRFLPQIEPIQSKFITWI